MEKTNQFSTLIFSTVSFLFDFWEEQFSGLDSIISNFDFGKKEIQVFFP